MHDLREPLFLLAITPDDEQTLFRTYRDYLVFLSLTRDMVQDGLNQVFAFSWLKQKAYLLFYSGQTYRAEPILHLMKRYYYWLQVGGQSNQRFKLQMIALKDKHECKDAIKFIHTQVLKFTNLPDPLAYHWHSYPVYHDYWQLNWLKVPQMLSLYSTNQLVAMQRFREHMLLVEQQDFEERLDIANQASREIAPRETDNHRHCHQIASPISDYHQGLNQKVEMDISIEQLEVIITIRTHRNG